MHTETKSNLKPETIAALQELIQINLDSRDGFYEVASHTGDIAVANLFHELGNQRDNQMAELRGVVEDNGGESETTGSLVAKAHRLLVDVRAALGGGTAVMLSEAEKGEDQIKDKYEQVLSKNPASAVNDILHRHYAAVKSGHDRVRDLRDSYPVKLTK